MCPEPFTDQKQVEAKSLIASHHSSKSVPSSTRRFTNNYAAFYGQENLTDKAIAIAKDIKRGGLGGYKQPDCMINPRNPDDPAFQANTYRFYGQADLSGPQAFYKDYRVFNEGSCKTPQLNNINQMASNFRDMQQKLTRQRLTAAAEQVLNTSTLEASFAHS